METFQIQIITPQRIEYEGEAESVTAPGESGSLGIMAHHASLLTSLTPGIVTIRKGDNIQHFALSIGGFLEVHRNKVLILSSGPIN